MGAGPDVVASGVGLVHVTSTSLAAKSWVDGVAAVAGVGHMKGLLGVAIVGIVAEGLHSTFGGSVESVYWEHHTCGVGHVPKERQQKLVSSTVECDIWGGMVATSVLPP